jgi:ribose transport system ATP-binding protein
VQSISKSFGGKPVLNDISLAIEPAEIHGLVGANGAGKSTLIKIIAGYHAPDHAGQLSIGGAGVPLPASARQLMAAGARFVHQDLGLIPGLTIAENFALGPGLSRKSLGLWTRRRELRSCQERLQQLGLSYAPDRLVQHLSIAQQVMVAVVRAVTDRAGPTTLLVLDEPTSGLPREQAALVTDLVKRTASQGVGILFVSHRLEEVLDVCDRITVLRDGFVIERLDRATDPRSYAIDPLTAAMFGVGLSAAPPVLPTDIHPPGDSPSMGGPLPAASEFPGQAGREVARLRVEGLAGDVVRDVSFAVRRGEVLGITGLIGAGASEVGRLLFGVHPTAGGRLFIDDVAFQPRSPKEAKARDVAYVPASRDLSLLKTLSVTENATLTDLAAFGRAWLHLAEERRTVSGLLSRFTVSPADPSRPVGTLSGGNQQKVALLKWLRCNPRLLILDEPCRGVDVSARRAIYDILRNAAAGGLSVIVISSEVEDVAELCDRVLLMQDGRLIQELSTPNITAETLTRALNEADAA